MEKKVACCGLDCAACDARIATVSNNEQLLMETVEKWKVQFNATDLSIDMVRCTGCREEGVKMIHCAQCEIKKCTTAKGYQTCAECEMLEKCELVWKIHQYDPTAMENLRLLNSN